MMSTLVNHPFTTVINNNARSLMKDAKTINDSEDINELERKLDVVNAISTKLTNQLSVANQSSRKDKSIIHRLNYSIQENNLLKETLERSIIRIRGSLNDRLQLNRNLDDKARLIAQLENLLEQKEAEQKDKISALREQINTLTNARDTLREKIDQKEKELVSIRELNLRMKEENPRLKSRIQTLEAELSALRNEFDIERQQLQLNIRSKQTELDRLKQKLEENKQEESRNEVELRRMQTQIDSLTRQLNESQTSLDVVRQQSDQSIQRLEDDLERLREEKGELQAQVEETNQSRINLETKNQQLQLQVGQLQEMITASKDHVANDTRLQQQLTQQIDRLQEEIRQLEIDKAVSTGQVEQFRQQLQVESSSLEKVNQEKNELNGRLAELTGQNTSLEKQVLTLEQLIEETKVELEKENLDKQRQLSLLQKGSIVEEENKKLEKEITELRSEKLTLETEIARLIKENSDEKTSLSQLEEKERKLLDQIKAKDSLLQETKAKLSKQEKLSKDLDNRIANTIRDNAAKTEEMTQRITERDQRIAELEQKIQQSTDSLSQKETIKTQLDEVQQQLRIKEAEWMAELKEQAETIRKLEAEIKKADATILEVTAKMAQSQVSIDSLVKKEEELASQLQANREQLQEKTTELTESVTRLDEEMIKNKSLEDQLAKVTLERNQLTVNIQEIERQQTLKEGEVKFKQTEMARLENDIEEKEKEILVQRRKTEKLSEERDELSRQIQSSNQQSERQAEKIAELEAKIAATTAQVEDLNRHKVEAETKAKTESEDIKRLEQQIRELEYVGEKESTENKQEITKLTAQIATLKEQLASSSKGKEVTQAEYENNVMRYEEQIKSLEDRIKDATQKIESEREEFEQAKKDSIKLMNLKDAEVDQLKKTIIEMKQKENTTMRAMEQETEERDELIKTLKEKIQAMNKDNQQVVQTLQKGLQDCEGVKAQMEADMKEERRQKEEELRRTVNKEEFEKVNKELDALKLRHQEDMRTVAERSSLIEEQKDKFEQLVREKEEKIAELEVRYQNLETEKMNASCLLLKGIGQLEMLMVEEKEVSELQSLMSDSITLYNRLMNTVFEPVKPPSRIDDLKMKNYVMSSLYMFYMWRTLVRIPIILRSDELVDQYFKYPLPEGEVLKVFKDKLGGDAVKQNFKQKIDPDGKRMRIDILLYFLIIALMSIADQDVSEFNLFLAYVYSLMKMTITNMSKLLTQIDSYNSTNADAIRMTHDKNSQIVTFVRFTSITPKETNKRFSYKILNDKILQMNYDETPVPFYEQNEQSKDWEEINDLKVNYNYQYWNGPFTGIFPADLDNDNIVNKRVFQETIEDRLRRLEPVCIVGYGASGSGKTTSLIYADYTIIKGGKSERIQRPGILILLANKLATEKQGMNQFDQCKVSLFEFETHPESKLDSNDDTKYICRKFPAKDNSATVRRIVRVQTNPDEYKYEENEVPYELCDQRSDEQFEYTFRNGEWENKDGEGIEKQLIEYINVKRNVAPSPNNPQSSRSHVICILTFTNKKGQQTSLVVCDFAGVENRFDCTDLRTLNNIGIPKLIEIEKESILLKSINTLDQTEQKEVMKSEYYPGARNIFLPAMYQACNDLYKYVRETLFRLNVATLPDLRKFYKTCLGKPSVVNEIMRIKIENAEATEQSRPIKKVPDGGGLQTTFLGMKLNSPLESYARDVNFDIGLIQDYLNVDTKVESSKLFFKPKDPKDKTNRLIQFAEDIPKQILIYHEKAYNFLISEYSSQVGGIDGNTMTLGNNLHFPSLIKVLVWYINKYKHYNAMYHSIISKKVEPLLDELAKPEILDNSFKNTLCETRIREGRFINKSLAQLRQFIGHTLKQNVSTGYAPFIDKCAPIQCNPYFRDCFGKNDYYDEDIVKSKNIRYQSEQFGPLSQVISNVPNASKLTFCIFTVVNLSKNANNPPPSPYIDISKLLIERERIKNIFSDANSKAIRIEPAVDSSGNVPKVVIDMGIIEELKRRPLLEYAPKSFRKTVIPIMNSIMASKGNVLDKIDTLVEEFTNFNAITTIGTLEFTDMMAKYASNRVICATKLPESFSYTGPVEPAAPVAVQVPSGGVQTRASVAATSQSRLPLMDKLAIQNR